jgi:manganese/zinc/iron transport system substrate-binding protein
LRSTLWVVAAGWVWVGGSLFGCDGRSTADERSGPLKVVCTIGMIADVAKNIGADRVAVQSLMGEGVDPHLYKATRGDLVALSEADLILYNGLTLEGKMTDHFVRLASRRPTVAVTETIDRDRLREPPEFAGHYDPHVWFDVSLWSKAVERVRDALIENDPGGEEMFRRNAKAYLAKLSTLHESIKREIATIPKAVRVIVTAHDAFGYFGDAYDIEVRGLQGISTDSEPSLKDINGLVDMIVERNVKAVFVESSVPPKNIEALVDGCKSRGHAIRVGGELFSDAMGAPGSTEGTYIGMVEHNVRTIVGALR